ERHLAALGPRVALAVGFGLVAAAAFLIRGGSAAARVPLVLGCVQLFLFAGPYRMDRHPEEVFPPQPGAEAVRAVLEEGTAGGGRMIRFARDMPLRPYPLSAVFPPSTNVPYGLRDLQGYNALADRRLGDALENALGENVFSHGIWTGRRIVAPERRESMEHPLLDALSVRAAVSRTEFRAAGWTPRPARGLLLKRNDEALPRVRLASHGRGVPEDVMAARLRAGDIDPRGEVLWVGEGSVGQPGAAVPSLHVTRDDWNEVEIRTHAETELLLVVADTFSKGWSATVDGLPAEILPVYGLVRGVVVPPGAERVRMTYVPPGFRAGSLLSLLGLCLAGGALAVSRRTL
ncbi:MAG: YfhO family protein, partial [Gemmatimonadetes bacterium]|nr:YfhO family protein [Gemmatimonadota bacterium]